MDLTSCGGQQNCHGQNRCLTHDLWSGLNQHIEEYLDNISLADLAAQQEVLSVAKRQASMQNKPMEKP